MHLYRVTIETHDLLRFSSREIGRFMETIPIVGEFALNYALGLVSPSPYHWRKQTPNYQYPDDCVILPAIPPSLASRETYTQLYSRNKEQYHYKTPNREDTAINLPLIERYCDIAPEQIFQTYLISQRARYLPHWVRIGKKGCKCEVLQEDLSFEVWEGNFESSHPVTGIKITQKYALIGFKSILSLPPTSIVFGAQLKGKYLICEDGILPLL